MSKSQVIHDLKVEIKRLNRSIDEKIMNGKSYIQDGRKHKLLRAQLSLIKRKSWLAKSMRFASMFLF